MPMAVIATSSAKREDSTAPWLMTDGSVMLLLSIISKINAIKKPGTPGVVLLAMSVPWLARNRLFNISNTTMMTGTSKLTRTSLVKVAMSPTGSDTEYPAPTTWATS